MKFGKLTDPDAIAQVDFSIPPDDDHLLEVLGGQASPNFRAYVGCPMWGNKGWLGKLYPKGTPQNQYLEHYSRSFNTIELNTTHYRVPRPEIIERWRDMTPIDFRFSPKIPQGISHYRKFLNAEEETKRFVDSISLFEERLGCSFVQLHPSFGPELMGNLERFLIAFPAGIPLAIEFRHADFFVDQQLIPEARAILEAHGAAPVITDVAGRRDVCQVSLTNKVAMIRFVGNALHATDYSRTDAWIERIAHWVSLGLEELYFFVHEPDDTYAPEMGEYVIKKLNERFGLDLAIPGIHNLGNQQMSLF
ncbi:MAG: DUF72 domain-containing protein [Bacteroidota bacterium]